MSQHTRGLLLTVAGVLLISPDSLLIRLIAMDVWSTSIWRGLFQCLGLTALIVLFHGARAPAQFRAIGGRGLLIAVITAATSFAFVAAIKFTTVANALVILATTPFHAAVMSHLFLGEVVSRRTWIAIAFGLAGIAIIVGDGLGRPTAIGDAIALLAAILLAAQLTLVRASRTINMIPATAIGAAIYALAALAISGPPEMPNANQALWIVVLGLVVITPATALLTLGPRYISSPEVGLIVLLETVLGSFWVWLVVGERPGAWGFVGGAVVIATLIGHATLSLRARQPQGVT